MKWFLYPAILSVFVAIVVGFLFFRSRSNRLSQGASSPPSLLNKLIKNKNSGHPNKLGLPNCNQVQYTTALVEVDQIESITPLGNLNPPEHTLPTEHMYFHLRYAGVELLAPASGVVTRISSSFNADTGQTDYSLTLALCEDVFAYFHHVKTLSTDFEKLIDEKNCSTYGDNNKYKHCWSEARANVKAGDVLGTVGNTRQKNFDFGSYDFRIDLKYANPERYGQLGRSQSRSIICPLDLYKESLKQELYKKVDRSITPLCGTVKQDVPGTLQGNWFTGDDKNWDNHLSFATDNFKPNLHVISAGGVFMQPAAVKFSPKHEGQINRAFAEVTPDEKTYCYDSSNNNFNGKILIRLTSKTQLEIERQTGSCKENTSLIKPTVYER